MRDRKMENLYRKIRNFSRKDLQGLCKKYGLPANTSNSEMATSLILYLKKKNLSIRAIWEGTRSDLFASGGDQKKGRGHIAYRSGSGNNQHHNDLLNFKDSTTSDKASIDVGSLTQLHQESISCSGVTSNVVAPTPSFTFDVCCEDGIQLYVDLNSSPADWIESLKSGVHINHDVHKHMLQSFDEDKGLLCCPYQRNGSVTINPSTETDNGQLQDGSLPTTILTDNLPQSDEPDEVKALLPSSGLKSLSSVIHSFGNAKDEKGYLFSRLNSGSQGQFPGAKPRRREEIVAADSDVNEAVQTRTHTFIGNSVPSDLKCSTKSAHHGANTGNDICKKSLLQLTDSSMDHVLERSELSTTISVEMKASNCATVSLDIECSPGNHSCINVVDQLKNNEVVQSGIVKSVQTPSWDELQMQPASTVHQSTCVSPLLKGLPLDIADNKRNVETEHSRTSFFRDSDRQIREVQSHSAGIHSKSSCNSCCHRYVSQDVINHIIGIETKNAGFIRTPEAGSETDELQQKDAALYPCRNDGSLELVVPKNNGVDHLISPKSNELQEEICRSPSKRRRSSRFFTK